MRHATCVEVVKYLPGELVLDVQNARIANKEQALVAVVRQKAQTVNAVVTPFTGLSFSYNY